MSNFIQNYEIILSNLRHIQKEENASFKPVKLKLTDLELVAINFEAEFMSIDSEHHLFRVLKRTYLKGKNAIVLPKKCIITVINYMQFVLLKVFFVILI